MTTLILAQSHLGQLQENTKRLVTAARAFSEPVHIFLLDDEKQQGALAAAELEGVDLVRVALTATPDQTGFDVTASIAFDLANQYKVIIAANSGAGRHVLPLLAARLQIPPITGVSAILEDQLAERPIYAGSLMEQVQLDPRKALLTLRPANFDTVGEQTPCPIEPVSFDPTPGNTLILDQISSKSDRPDLGDAKVVVAGGRGFGSKENFAQLEPLADALGAALGASRIAVDMGWAPHNLQVGQTGVQIAPDLYIAIGISGAVQHIAGIKDAGKIIALNKDPEAPIFKVADYGIVGDLHTLLPELEKALVEKP